MMSRMRLFLTATLISISSLQLTTSDSQIFYPVRDVLTVKQSQVIPAAGTLEVAFSPYEGAERLVLKVIDAAQSEIKILAHSFTSASVTAALLRAKKRGITVSVVADHKNNLFANHNGKARAALSTLANAGCDVRTITAYRIHHDKVLIVDRHIVELGSFNYSAAAAHSNSENVLVNWNNPKLAKIYLAHFDRNQRQAFPFQSAY